MGITLGHFFILMALIEPLFVWKLLDGMRAEDDRKPEEERRPAGIIMAAAVLTSVGLIAFALLHPIGDLPIL